MILYCKAYVFNNICLPCRFRSTVNFPLGSGMDTSGNSPGHVLISFVQRPVGCFHHLHLIMPFKLPELHQ